jgi:hypothetical protein
MLIEGREFKFTKPVRYKFTDPVKGELYQRNIIPAFSVKSNPKLVINKGHIEWEVRSLKDSNLFKVISEPLQETIWRHNGVLLKKIRLLNGRRIWKWYSINYRCRSG